MEDNGGAIIYATKGQIEKLKESVIWQDIVRELDIWVRAFKIEQSNIVDDSKSDNPSTASVLMHMGDINGRIKTVEFMKSLPDMFLEILELNSKNNLMEETKDGDD